MVDPAALAEQLTVLLKTRGVATISGENLRVVIAALRRQQRQSPAAEIAAQARRYSDGAV